jgi:hypothetical protein
MRYWDRLSKEERIERWQNVLRVLRALTPHERKRHFDMSWWGLKTDCGTVACAAGHCGMDPWFRRRGFKLRFGKDAKIGESPSVTEFFGFEGAHGIFLNSTIRPVGLVIKEIRQHIKNLKASPDGDIDYRYGGA